MYAPGAPSRKVRNEEISNEIALALNAEENARVDVKVESRSWNG